MKWPEVVSTFFLGLGAIGMLAFFGLLLHTIIHSEWVFYIPPGIVVMFLTGLALRWVFDW